MNKPVSVVVGQDGKEEKEVSTRKSSRAKSPEENREESKENIEEEYDPGVAVDDNGNTVKYPCPECKKGFSKVGNVYKHLSNHHGMAKSEYIKMRQEIQDNAYVVDKAGDGVTEKPQKAALQNLALAIGLVNKQGVGLQKFNKTEKPQEKTVEELTLSELQAPRRGRPVRTRNPDTVMEEETVKK